MIELAIQMKDLLNPEFYIQHGGVWLFLFIVFAETGLFAGFFLPGDSLLFVAGIYSNELASEIVNLNNDFLNMMMVCVLVIFSGILGNIVGYWFELPVGHFCSAERIHFSSRKTFVHCKRVLRKARRRCNCFCEISSHHQNFCSYRCRCCENG